MKGAARILLAMERLGMIKPWKQYNEPIGPPDTPWGSSTRSQFSPNDKSRAVMVIDHESDRLVAELLNA